MFMETETNKKSVDPKYKKRSKVIIIISLLVLLWCVKDLFEVVVTPDEMIPYIVTIPILVFVIIIRIKITWLKK